MKEKAQQPLNISKPKENFPIELKSKLVFMLFRIIRNNDLVIVYNAFFWFGVRRRLEIKRGQIFNLGSLLNNVVCNCQF